MNNTVFVKKPGDVFRKEEFPASDKQLEWLQEKVGGYIETIPFMDSNSILLVCNEEGKLQGLEPNCCINGDMIVGTIVLVSFNEEGDMLPLTPEQETYIRETVPVKCRPRWFGDE